jgi:hypothetical protein
MLAFTLKFGDERIVVDLKEAAKVFRTMGGMIDAQAQAILLEEGKNATGMLSESIKHEVMMDNTSVWIAWPDIMPYWDFVEQGVQGFISNAKAPQSPFKFGSGTGPKGALRPAIRQWIVDKPVGQWRDLATGRFMSYDGMAKLISRKVYLHGIAPTPFMRPTIRTHFTMYKKNLEAAYNVDIGNAIGVWLKSKSTEFIAEYKI